MAAQIALAQCTEDSVGQRMRRDISIGMTLQAVGMWNLDARQDQAASLGKRMEIKALSDAEAHLLDQAIARVDNRRRRVQAF